MTRPTLSWQYFPSERRNNRFVNKAARRSRAARAMVSARFGQFEPRRLGYGDRLGDFPVPPRCRV